MIAYICRRFLSMIPSLFLASVIVFSFIHFIPGDPAQVMLERMSVPARIVALVNRYDNLCNPPQPGR